MDREMEVLVLNTDTPNPYVHIRKQGGDRIDMTPGEALGLLRALIANRKAIRAVLLDGLAKQEQAAMLDLLRIRTRIIEAGGTPDPKPLRCEDVADDIAEALPVDEDDRETIAPGDHRYYHPRGLSDAERAELGEND